MAWQKSINSNRIVDVDVNVDQIIDYIGNKTDHLPIPFDPLLATIMSYLQAEFYHVHGEPFIYPNYANDITLTSNAGAWDTGGAITEIIPAGALLNKAGQLRAFDIHFINISDISAVGTYVIDLYKGAALSEEWIGATKPRRGSVFSQELPRRIQIPQQLAGERISAKLTSSNAGANTLNVSVEGHFYG